MLYCFFTVLYAQDRELIPVSKTEFVYIDRSGNEHDIDLTSKDFILVSVREKGSDGRFYAVDRDGTVWLSGGISSGEEMGFTSSGKWRILHKKRYYTSKRYPEPDGSNNMDYSLFFTPWGMRSIREILTTLLTAASMWTKKTYRCCTIGCGQGCLYSSPVTAICNSQGRIFAASTKPTKNIPEKKTIDLLRHFHLFFCVKLYKQGQFKEGINVCST